MNDILLLKQGELILKGQNRRIFEQRLVAHIKRRLATIGEFRVYAMQSTVYVEPRGDADMDAAFEALEEKIKNTEIGATFFLGETEQDNNTENKDKGTKK